MLEVFIRSFTVHREADALKRWLLPKSLCSSLCLDSSKFC